MLTGSELGAAIESAIVAKKITKKALADRFGIKPPSVQTWVKHGRIDKSKLIELIAYFSDTVPPEHWGLTAKEADLVVRSKHPAAAAALTAEEYYALDTLYSLRGKTTPRSMKALESIEQAANEGRLTEDDILLLERIAKRFENQKQHD
ncbi:hypothetical protein HNP46_002174 [Pseudomonas nitritireducens]|uniref:Helix-turn-helix domain-containing protein n=1 Tax=Pseudomonas nitroreducens TaxID=46680 RepID=A0A7W7KIB4_PSENT|nr:hypothetical protein [Pseudomonas nitritireducens]MBB4863327.1 hypothetical protein [Pseudomonas nitritireducens]